MIDKLTKEQEDSFPHFVTKWTTVGQSTGVCDLSKAKPLIKQIHKNAKLIAPKYFFHFKNPLNMIQSIAIVKALEKFDINKNYGSDVFPEEFQNWMNAFEQTFTQYSEQYKNLDWSKPNLKENMIAFIANYFAGKNPKDVIKQYENEVLYGNHEAHNLAYYDFFYTHFKFDFIEPLLPFFDLAEHLGWWSAQGEIVFLSDKPLEISFDQNGRIHNTEKPAIVYGDDFYLCVVEDLVVEDHVVLNPETITIKEINSEENVEIRRIKMQQYGMEKYFDNAKVKIIDQDFTVVDYNKQESMPRMLVETKFGDIFLVGTDGSTNRVYHMSVGNDESIKRLETRFNRKFRTCKAVHELISGVSETNIISQS